MLTVPSLPLILTNPGCPLTPTFPKDSPASLGFPPPSPIVGVLTCFLVEAPQQQVFPWFQGLVGILGTRGVSWAGEGIECGCDHS